MAVDRRRFLGVVVAGSFGLLACACGGPPASGGAPPASAGGAGGAGPAPAAASRADVVAADAAKPGDVKVLVLIDGAGAPGGGLKDPNGVAVDDEENLYVADTANKRVVKFGKDGRFVAAWTGEGEDALVLPVDLAIGPGGHVFVLDRGSGYVQSFTREGKPVAKIAGPGSGLYNPFGIAASAEAVFIADTGSARVVKYSPTGERQLELATAGSGPGALREPTGLVVDPDGTIVIIDGGSARLLRYKADGSFLAGTEVAASGRARIARRPDGSYLVTDPGKSRLLHWDQQGKLLGSFGVKGTEEGRFDVPTGIAADRAGNVYVADSQNNRVQKLRLD